MMREMYTGWIKPGKYGRSTDNEGNVSFWLYPFHIRWFVLRPVKLIQKTLWLCGIAVHDPVFGECTPDFNCCCKGIGRKSLVNIPQKKNCTDGQCGKCPNCLIDPI